MMLPGGLCTDKLSRCPLDIRFINNIVCIALVFDAKLAFRFLQSRQFEYYKFQKHSYRLPCDSRPPRSATGTPGIPPSCGSSAAQTASEACVVFI